VSCPVVKLGDVVSFVGGSQPPKSSFIYEPKEGYVRLLQIRDYKSDKNLTYIKEDSTKKFCTKHDVMIGRYGPPVFQILKGLEGAYNVALMKAKPSEKVDKDYLYHFLKQDKLFRLIDGLSQRTAGQSGVDMDALKDYPMLLPPLNEQKRIVTILDKADAIRRKRQQGINLADDFLRSVFLDMFGDPVTNPKGWDVKSLKELTNKLGSGSTPRGGKEAYIEQGISLIRSLNVHDNKFVHKNLAFISDEQAEKLKNVIIEKDDLLLNITGASVCRAALVDNDILPARVNQHVCIVRTKPEKVLPIFIARLITSSSYKQKIMSIASAGGATREALTKLQVESLDVIVPPIGVQERFESIVQSTLQLLQRAKNQSHQPLFESLSQKAFSGEL